MFCVSAISKAKGTVTATQADPLAGIGFGLRLQKPSGVLPVRFWQDIEKTISAIAEWDPVAVWEDTEREVEAVQADPDKQPILDSDGLPRYDGIDDCLLGTLSTYKAALVFRAKANAGNAGAVYSDGAASGTHQPYGDGLVYENFAANTRVDSIPTSGALYDLAVYQANNVAGTHTVRINGLLVSSVSRTVRPSLAFVIGSFEGLYFYEGVISDVFICDPGPDAEAAESYLLNQ